MRIHIGILFRAGEEDDALNLVRTLAHQHGVHTAKLFLVYNDMGPCRIERALNMFENVVLALPGRNLGVASGRSLLLRDSSFLDADICGFLDSDIVVALNFLESIVAIHEEHQPTGLFGPTILDFHSVRRASKDVILKSETEDGDSFMVFDDEALWSAIADAPEAIRPGHCGGTPDIRTAYLRTDALSDQLLSAHNKDHGRTVFKYNQESPEVVDEFRDCASRIPKALDASNVPGGASFFSPKLIEEIGTYDDIFSPYGMEDVDFAYRCELAGKRNIVALDHVLLHGVHDRHGTRRRLATFSWFQTLSHRAVALFFLKHAETPTKSYFEWAAAGFALDLSRNFNHSEVRFAAAIEGYQWAVEDWLRREKPKDKLLSSPPFSLREFDNFISDRNAQYSDIDGFAHAWALGFPGRQTNLGFTANPTVFILDRFTGLVNKIRLASYVDLPPSDKVALLRDEVLPEFVEYLLDTPLFMLRLAMTVGQTMRSADAERASANRKPNGNANRMAAIGATDQFLREIGGRELASELLFRIRRRLSFHKAA